MFENIGKDNEGGPINLILIDGDDKFHVNPDCIKFLEQIEQDVCVVCVAGPQRTGKSYLCSRFAGRQKGFALGATQNACTKGIWLWNKPIEMKVNGVVKTVIIMDTEGLLDPEVSEDHDIKIFAISVLLSSYFIFNKIGPIDSKSLNELSFILKITQMIKINRKSADEDQSDKFVEYFPSFLWCARDFTLKLEDAKTGDRITSDKYLENCLASGSNKKMNDIKQMIRTCFRKRKCYCLRRPLHNEEDLQKIDDFEYEDLRPEFTNEADKLLKYVYSDIKELQIKKPSDDENSGLINVNGRSFAYLAKYYVDKINNGEIPDFVESFVAISERECSLAKEKAFNLYRKSIHEITEDKVFEVEELMNIHDQLWEKTVALYKSEARGDQEIFKRHFTNLNESIIVYSEMGKKVIGGEFNAILQRNRDKSSEICAQVKELLVNQFRESIASNKITTAQEFSHTFDELCVNYNAIAKGPSKSEVEQQFLRELDFLKQNFILDKRIEEADNKILQQQLENAKIAADLQNATAGLEQQRAEHDSLKKQLELEMNTMAEKHRKEQEAIRIHHNETLAKLEEEWKKYNDQQQKEMAEEMQSKINETNEKYRKKMKKMKKENKAREENLTKERESMMGEVNNLKLQVQNNQIELENARRDAKNAKASMWMPIIQAGIEILKDGILKIPFSSLLSSSNSSNNQPSTPSSN